MPGKMGLEVRGKEDVAVGSQPMTMMKVNEMLGWDRRRYVEGLHLLTANTINTGENRG